VAKRSLVKKRGTGSLRQLAQAIGVTRVARVTGLDRTGVEVACAVRPNGHLLQVSNGKGPDWETAAASALFEATELWAAEHPPAHGLRWASARQLRREGNEVWDPLDLGDEGGALWSEHTHLAWLRAQCVHRRGEVWVPAQAAYSPPDDASAIGPAVLQWTSNGLAAGLRRERAVSHALAEVMEREALCRAMPEGWTGEAIRRLQRSRWSRDGFGVRVLDVTPARWAWPVAAAVIEEGPESVIGATAGYACRPRWNDAVTAAVLEAAQSRLTDIHGAREDVVEPTGRKVELSQRAMRPSGSTPCASSRAATVREAIASLRRPVAIVDLTSPLSGVHVVKAWVAGFRVSELLK
jgi:ribosomal protein S12 methylthiotransferase accessory factor